MTTFKTAPTRSANSAAEALTEAIDEPLARALSRAVLDRAREGNGTEAEITAALRQTGDIE
jgi:hypothetical protein